MAIMEFMTKVDETLSNDKSAWFFYKPAVTYPQPQYKRVDLVGQFGPSENLQDEFRLNLAEAKNVWKHKKKKLKTLVLKKVKRAQDNSPFISSSKVVG